MNLLVTAGDSVRDAPGRPTGVSLALPRYEGRRGAQAVKLVMTLLVRDEADIVDAHIAFHLNAGVDLVLATDHRSRDGTTEILESYERKGYVRLIREEGERIRQASWVTRMARLAATEHDADEFWWPRGGSLKEVLAAVPERYGVVHAVSRPFVPVPDDGRHFAERMTVRLTAPAPINDTATPFRPVAKAAHRGDPRVVVGEGNHEVSGIDRPPFRWSPIELLHFPLRSPGQCARKYEKTWLSWEENLRGDIARARTLPPSERSRGFWDRVVVDDVARACGLADSSIVTDTRLRDALRTLAGVPELPADGTTGFALPGDPPRLVFPHPTLADEVAYVVDGAVLREASVVRARRRVDELEDRIASLERRGSRVVRS